jgi:hypothetical protein
MSTRNERLARSLESLSLRAGQPITVRPLRNGYFIADSFPGRTRPVRLRLSDVQMAINTLSNRLDGGHRRLRPKPSTAPSPPKRDDEQEAITALTGLAL